MGGCTSSHEFGSQGGAGAFCLKMCDVLHVAQQDGFSTTLQSILVICKFCNEINATCLKFLQFFQVSLACFDKLAFEAGFLLDFRE